MYRVVFVAAVALLSGCVAPGVAKDIDKLERSVSDLRAMQAEQTDVISALDSQLRALSGRVEEMEFAQTKRFGSDLSALKEDISSLRRRVPPPAVVPIPELEADEAWASSLPAESAQVFTDGLSLLREGKFGDALPLLQSVLEQTSSSPKAAVPLFWQGVAFDGLSDNRGALKAYSEVVSRHPKSNRAASALYRQSMVFVRLGDKKTATLSLRKLLDDYPKSPEAAMAKDKLKELK
jgi:TolA-binding protein